MITPSIPADPVREPPVFLTEAPTGVTPPSATSKRAAPAAVALWLILMAAVWSAPFLLDSPTRDDDLTRNTVRVSLVFYALAAALMLRLRPDEWRPDHPGFRLARLVWTLAWAGYIVHLYAAFRYYHHGSHAAAVEHTRRASGVGEAIYVSHLFTLLWTADVAYAWLFPARYATRPPWVGRTLHAFMAFIVFNGMVVFETGPIRWAGVLLFVGLAPLWLLGRPARTGAGAAPSLEEEPPRVAT